MFNSRFQKDPSGSSGQDPYSSLGASNDDNRHGRGVLPRELQSSKVTSRTAYDPPVVLHPSHTDNNTTSPMKRNHEFELDQSSKDPFQRILGQNAKVSSFLITHYVKSFSADQRYC